MRDVSEDSGPWCARDTERFKKTSVEPRRWGAGGLALLALTLALCACEREVAFSLSTTTLDFSSSMAVGVAPTSQALILKVLSDDPVYFGILYDDGPDSPIREVSLEPIDETTASVRVFVKTPGDVAPGYHRGVIMFVGCADPECSEEVRGSRKVVIVGYQVDADLQASPAALTFSQTHDPTPPPAQQLRIDRILPGPVYPSWRLSVQTEDGGDWLQVNSGWGNALPATLEVAVKPLLQAGTYRGTLHFSVDAQINDYYIQSYYSWVDVPVTYTVEQSALTVSADHAGLALASRTTLEQLSQAQAVLTVSGVAADPPLSWTATSDAPWLQVSPSSGTSASPTQVSLAPVLDELGRMTYGDYSTTVTFRYVDVSGLSKVLRVPVTLRTELPEVDYTWPYVAAAGRSDQILLYGRGFSGLQPQVFFGTQPALAVEVRSDSELLVTHPALPAGSYYVSLDIAPYLSSSIAWLAVQDFP